MTLFDLAARCLKAAGLALWSGVSALLPATRRHHAALSNRMRSAVDPWPAGNEVLAVNQSVLTYYRARFAPDLRAVYRCEPRTLAPVQVAAAILFVASGDRGIEA